MRFIGHPHTFLLVAALLSGCFDSATSPDSKEPVSAASGGLEFHPEIGLGKFKFGGYIDIGADGSLVSKLQFQDSSGARVLLRTGDRIVYRVGGWDTAVGNDTIALPKSIPGDSVVVEVVLRDSGRVFQARSVVPQPAAFHPRILPKDTLLEIDFDSAWSWVNMSDSVSILGSDGRTLVGIGTISAMAVWIFGRHDSLGEIEPRSTVGAIFVDLRSLVRASATVERPDSAFLRIESDAQVRDFTVSASPVQASHLSWWFDSLAHWDFRIPLGL